MAKPEAWTPAGVPVPEDGWYLVTTDPESLTTSVDDTSFQKRGTHIDAPWSGWIGPLPEVIAEPTTADDEPLADPLEVQVQIATFNAVETAEAVAKVTDAIGSLVGRVSDGEVHRAVTRGLDVALELADLARRDLGTLRDVLHEVE